MKRVKTIERRIKLNTLFKTINNKLDSVLYLDLLDLGPISPRLNHGPQYISVLHHAGQVVGICCPSVPLESVHISCPVSASSPCSMSRLP